MIPSHPIRARFALLCWLVAATAAPGIAQGTVDEADRLFSAGRFEPARAAYAREVSADPRRFAARAGLIRSLMRLDRWEETLKAAHAASDAFPNEADAHALLSLALMRGGQPDDAATEAAAAQKLAPSGYWSLVAAGRVQAWNNQDKLAVSTFRQATTVDSARPEAWYYLIDSTNSSEIRPSDLDDVATYIGLKPTGHPHDLARDLIPSRLPLLRSFLNDPPFRAETPERDTLLKSADRGETPPVAFTVPIQRVGDYLGVSVLLQGQRLQLLYDTGGGSDLTLNQAAADRLKLTSLGRTNVYGVSGKEGARLYKADTLRMGSETFRSIPIEAVGDGVPSFDGILGGSAFDHYAVTIDFKQNTLTLARGGEAPPPLAGDRLITVPFHYVDGDMVIPVTLDGRSGWAVVDTGSENYVLLSLHLARKIAASRRKDRSREAAIGGKMGIGATVTNQTMLAFADPVSLRIDGTSGAPLNARIDPAVGAAPLDTQVSPATDFELDGLIGVPFLSTARRVTFDYPHRRLTLEFPIQIR